MSRIPQKKFSDAARAAFNGTYDSPFIGQDTLENIQKSARAYANDGSYAKASARSALTLAQAVVGISGERTQLPKSSLSAAFKLISQNSWVKDSAKFLKLAQEFPSGILGIVDTALSQSLAAIPVVGAIGSLTLSLVRVIRTMRERSAPQYIEPFRLDKDGDSAETSLWLGYLSQGSNWTRLFLPPRKGPFDLRIEAADRVEFQQKTPRSDSAHMGGGILPGTLARSVDHVVARWPKEMVAIPKPKSGKEVTPNDLIDANRDLLDNLVYDAGNLTPSLQRLGAATWAAATSRMSTSMFNIATDPIIRAWFEYSKELDRFADFVMKDNSKLGAVFTTQQRRARMYLAAVGLSRSDDVVGAGEALVAGKRYNYAGVATRHCQHLAKMQREMLETPLVATASVKQAAFKDNAELLEKLKRNRKKMLDAGKLDNVHLDDIVDKDFRSKVLASRRSSPDAPVATSPTTSTSTITRAQIARELQKKKIRRGLDFEEVEEVKADKNNRERGGGGGVAVLATLVAAGLGVAALGRK